VAARVSEPQLGPVMAISQSRLPTQDVDPRCQRALKRLLNPNGSQRSHVFCDMWDMADGSKPPAGSSGSPGLLFRHIASMSLAITAFCVGHGWRCCIPAADIDVTGTPCQDFSGCGHGQADQGPQMVIFLLWCHLMLARQIPILVHENVPEFWETLLHANLGHAYWIFSSVMDCADVGFHLISRRRRYTIMYHKDRCRLRYNPVTLYVHLTETMKASLGHWQSQIWHCFLADANEIAIEPTWLPGCSALVNTHAIAAGLFSTYATILRQAG
jgi:hypothetical protein